MKSEQNKRENRKALKVFVPTLLISGASEVYSDIFLKQRAR